jgi:hypothetical protein
MAYERGKTLFDLDDWPEYLQISYTRSETENCSILHTPVENSVK